MPRCSDRKNTPGSYSADRLAGGHSSFSLLRLWSKCGEGPVEIADVEQAVRNRGRSIKDGAFGVILILEEYSSVCRIQHEEGGPGRGHHQPGYSSWRGQHAVGRGEAAFPQIGSCGRVERARGPSLLSGEQDGSRAEISIRDGFRIRYPPRPDDGKRAGAQ